MGSQPLTLTPINGLPLVKQGDDLGEIIVAAINKANLIVTDDDVLVVTHKIVSKAEGRIVDLETVAPSGEATALAEATGKDPRFLEVVLAESTAVVRSRQGLVITEHRLGWIMANAGVDQSNVEQSTAGRHVLLLPANPDSSAAALKRHFDNAFGAEVGVLISDSFGRPWRNGVVGIALGVAGIPALRDLRGAPDLYGRPLEVTEVAVGDALAAAAALVMGEADDGCPVVHVRGLVFEEAAVAAAALIRPKERDLFR